MLTIISVFIVCHMKVSILNKEFLPKIGLSLPMSVSDDFGCIVFHTNYTESNYIAPILRTLQTDHVSESSMFSIWKVIDIICTQSIHVTNMIEQERKSKREGALAHMCTGLVRFANGLTCNVHTECVSEKTIAERAKYSNNKTFLRGN